MATKNAEQEAPPEAVAKKKSGLLKWGILAVIILALGAGGYVGWTHFAPTAGSSSTEAKPSQTVVYELDTFLVNLADPGGRRYLKVNIKLDLSSPQVEKEFNAEKYRLRDMILMLLSSKQYNDIATLSGKMALKQEIMARLNGTLKQGRVKQVYFTEFLIQ